MIAPHPVTRQDERPAMPRKRLAADGTIATNLRGIAVRAWFVNHAGALRRHESDVIPE